LVECVSFKTRGFGISTLPPFSPPG
jgi:hypothetical protein